MKKCSYCGAECPDDSIVCPVDQTPFADSAVVGKKKEHPHRIGPAGFWLIFSGIPIAVLAILLTSTLTRDGNIRGVSERALPYVLLFVPAAIIVGCRELYHHVPKRLIIPFGFVGWIIALSVACWYFWFG